MGQQPPNPSANLLVLQQLRLSQMGDPSHRAFLLARFSTVFYINEVFKTSIQIASLDFSLPPWSSQHLQQGVQSILRMEGCGVQVGYGAHLS